MNKALKLTILLLSLLASNNISAQIKYSNANLTIGTTTPYSFYNVTIISSGMHLMTGGEEYLSFDLSNNSPSISGTGDRVVFYNTQTSTYNDIEIKTCFQTSDARFKQNIAKLQSTTNIVKALKPVSYKFKKQDETDKMDMGLIAQDLEKILPDLVIEDSEGKKLVNYIALIPILIKEVQTLQQRVDHLKQQK